MYKNILLIAVIFSIAAIGFTGCSGEEKGEKEKKQEMNGHNENQSDIIRKKGFEAASIDNNKDGNVYQCPMDYEVISDEHDNCPVCGMKLEEVSIETAQQNFNKYME